MYQSTLRELNLNGGEGGRDRRGSGGEEGSDRRGSGGEGRGSGH